MAIQTHQIRQHLELERRLLMSRINSRQEAAAADCDAVFWWKKDRAKLERIKQAQQRLESGTYGICTVCQEPINPERLEVAPYVETCIHCQSQLERRALKYQHIK